MGFKHAKSGEVVIPVPRGLNYIKLVRREGNRVMPSGDTVGRDRHLLSVHKHATDEAMARKIVVGSERLTSV